MSIIDFRVLEIYLFRLGARSMTSGVVLLTVNSPRHGLLNIPPVVWHPISPRGTIGSTGLRSLIWHSPVPHVNNIGGH